MATKDSGGVLDASSSLPPVRLEEVFRLAFSNNIASHAEPPAALVGEVQAFRIYVTKLVQRLNAESRTLAEQVNDSLILAQKAKDLLRIEMQRHKALLPYLAQHALPPPNGGPQKSWEKIRSHLREAMAQELEAVRDARLRLEVKSAELVNQRAQVSARIVLKGGAQIKMHFGRLKGNAAQKT
jgi:sulfite reductase alpha subunit-like flavoprotein